MKRADATSRLQDILRRVASGGWPSDLIDEIAVFGSYARGALTVGDLDLFVHHHVDERLGDFRVSAMFERRNPDLPLDRLIRGPARSIHPVYNQRRVQGATDDDAVIVFRRGDSLAQALARLDAIQEDTDATRAARAELVAPLQGLEGVTIANDRLFLDVAARSGMVAVTRAEMDPDLPLNPAAATLIGWRYRSAASPKARAARAALAHLSGEGLGPWRLGKGEAAFETVDESAVIALFQRGLADAVHYLSWDDRELWCEILRFPKRGLVPALLIRRGPHPGEVRDGRYPLLDEAHTLFTLREWGNLERVAGVELRRA